MLSKVNLAAIDVGTNSTRLLIAAVSSGRIDHHVLRYARVTGLGKGAAPDGTLSQEAMARTLGAISDYSDILASEGISQVTASATSAVRMAPNGPDFLERVRELTGIELSVLSGRREGELTFLGATGDVEAGTPCLVVDIGGGSTEFSWGEAGKVAEVISIETGCVRLKEDFLSADAPDANAVRAASDFVSERLDTEGVVESLVEFAPECLALAVAGTPTSLAAMSMKLEPYDPAKVHGFVLERKAVGDWSARLTGLSLAQLRELPGLHRDRAPTILAGVVILETLMRELCVAQVITSERDILDGMILDVLRGMGNG